MNDINSKNKNDTIGEELIDENIPRDLMHLYNTQSYESQRNPETRHAELFSYSRRSKLYDYGKAEYRVVSPEEALQMVKNNKQDIQNLRIIFQGNLVEYEVRDNGSIYAIYRSSDYVELNGKEYRNVGYAPWKQVIEAADKIYWTDEYSRKISPEEQAKRAEKEAERVIYRGKHPGDFGYDEHKPFGNLMNGSPIRRKAMPDTGHHNQDSTKMSRYTQYDLARKALKRLENDRELYDAAEYEELHAKFSALKKQAFDAYNALLRAVALGTPKDRDVKEISAETHAFNQKLANYTRTIQAALESSYNLKKKLDSLLTTTANNTGDISADLKKLRKDLSSAIDDLKDDSNALSNAKDDFTQQQAEKLLADLVAYKTDYVNKHLNDLASIDQEMKEIEELIAKYRPNTTARKARIAAAQAKELSPELLNVIEFGNF